MIILISINSSLFFNNIYTNRIYYKESYVKVYIRNFRNKNNNKY
jgi:hypothetical protein